MQFPPIPETGEEHHLDFFQEDISVDLPDEESLRRWLLECAAEEKKAVRNIAYIFCSDEYLHRINVDFLKHDDYTDVITFSYAEGGNDLEGDVFVSAERVADNATQLRVPFHHELCRVMVHGLLHLAGYDDKTPELRQAMREREETHLTRFFSS